MLVSFAAFALAASAMDSPPPLEPTANWVIDYAEDQCFLTRKFGTGEKRVIFGFGLLPGAIGEQIFLIEPSRDVGGARSVTGQFELGPDQERVTAGGISGRLKEGGRITRFGALAETVDSFRKADQVTIRADGQRYHLRLSDMKAAFAAAEACKRDLMQSWGLDPKLITDVVKPPQPIGSPAAWVRPEDYPQESLGTSGRVVVRLDIDATGALTGCAVVQASGSEALDKVTCALMRSRARFRPARDAADKAIPTIRILRFVWQS